MAHEIANAAIVNTKIGCRPAMCRIHRVYANSAARSVVQAGREIVRGDPPTPDGRSRRRLCGPVPAAE